MWMFVMDSFKLLMIVPMREPSHDELFYSPQKITEQVPPEKKTV
jgi:hypothetical protein